VFTLGPTAEATLVIIPINHEVFKLINWLDSYHGQQGSSGQDKGREEEDDGRARRRRGVLSLSLVISHSKVLSLVCPLIPSPLLSPPSSAPCVTVVC
jgi:hypothetical protein